MSLLLQHKILVGYFLLMAIIGSMAATLLHERNRVIGIESEMKHIHRVQHDVNTAHRYITLLAMRGETAIAWEKEDFEDYRSLRLRVDTMLQTMQSGSEEFVSRAQIDTLRHLLANKEEHLHQIMLLFREQDNPDGLLLTRLPEEAKTKTVTRKKKGVAGFFGAKETVHVTPSASATLQALNKELQSMQEERQEAIDTYADSLCRHNKALNRKLRTLINTMNNQTDRVLEAKSRHLQDSYNRSTRIITGLIVFAIVLLAISYLIIQKDLREKARTRKRLEETIEQNAALLEMRKNIILTISHDIRAPLNIISGNAELAMDTRERKRRNIYLDNIGIVCRHVVHLLNNLLDVYRLNEAKEIRNDVPFNLHELLERTASGFSHVVNNKGIRFDCDFRDTEVRLYGDADRIEQIIDNLLTNAVKFTESGTISFNVSYHSGQLVMEVKDTGIGMTEETLSRIFRPFERLTSQSNADGYGLGLPITQGLVNLLDGSIEVTSSVDRGSTFRVTLPLPETEEPLVSDNRILPCPEHLPHNVLVIDDDSMLRDVIKEMLERNGVACTVCSSAKEVVSSMRCKDYDLLLSDIQMPGTNGFELLSLLRSSNIGNSRTIPVIAMTARGDKEKDAFLDAGFTDCIYKPFSSSELLGLLSTIKRCRKDDGLDIDFSVMLSEISDKIGLLRSFIIQSEKDMEELSAGMNDCDRHKLRETVHRMQPMWELLQMEDALSSYHALLKDDTATDDAVREHTRQIMECTAKFIAEAENEIKRQTNEKKILIVEDNVGLSQMQKDWFSQAGYEAVTAMNEPIARSLIRKTQFDLILSDVRLPEGDGISLLEWLRKERKDIPFIITTEYVSVPDVVRTIKLGAIDYLPKPVRKEHLLELAEDVFRPMVIVRKQEKKLFHRTSPKILQVEKYARQVAPSEMSVMVLGANGTGKESVAQSIHQGSERWNMPFVAVNCGALPRELAASLFFGHEKGAFTGADAAKTGYFDMAKGGTLFLDEIGTMSYETQSMLLRVLQENTYTPIGSGKERVADVRIVSATNEDLQQAIKQGRFREDLYHRLCEFEIRQPSLADCAEDIIPLAEFFRERYSKELKRETCGFTDDAKRRMLAYPWPGNVRELQNKIKRSVLVSEEPILDIEGLDNGIPPCDNAQASVPAVLPLKDESLEKKNIINALKACNGHREQAAAMLNVNPATLYRKMKKYGLK